MNTSELPTTEPFPSKSTVDIESESAELCSVCHHPWADHDALGTRFCAATVTSDLTRGCICRR